MFVAPRRRLTRSRGTWTVLPTCALKAANGRLSSVFSTPASVGVMERDLCIADVFVPSKRGGLDPANLKMALYLRGQLHDIPQDIPTLSDEEKAKPPHPRSFQGPEDAASLPQYRWFVQGDVRKTRTHWCKKHHSTKFRVSVSCTTVA